MNLSESNSIVPFAHQPVIHLIRIVNPFDPKQRVRDLALWEREKPLNQYLPALEGDHIVSLNGRIIEEAEWGLTYLSPGDHLVCCPVPHGGNKASGKAILRTVAMLAVATFAAPAAFAMFGSALGAGSLAAFSASIGGEIATFGVMMAGAKLVNSLMPAPATPQADNSKAYGIDGPKNTSDENVAIPVCYGSFRMAGNLINTRVEPSGTSQDLYVMFCAGEGPVASLSDIYINDQPLSGFMHADHQFQLGTAGQQSNGWFDSIYNSGNLMGSNKIEDATWITYTTQTVIDRFRVDITAPNGLFYTDSDGNEQWTSVGVQVQFKPHDAPDNAWQDMVTQAINFYVRENHITGNGTYDNQGRLIGNPPETVTTDTNKTIDMNKGYSSGRIFQKYPNGWGNSNDMVWEGYDDDWQKYAGNPVVGYWRAAPIYYTASGNITINGKQHSALRCYYTSQNVAQGIYDVRVRRTSAESQDLKTINALILSDIVEIENDVVAYRNLATVSLRMTLGDQINGLPQVTYLCGGRIIRQWDFTNNQWTDGPSSNPAWITLDMMTHTRYGGGFDLGRFDLDAWKDWAQWCDSQGLQFNGVIDVNQNLWDALQVVCRIGHAQILNVGTRFSLAIEKPADPVMLFSVANIVEDTFQETWTSITDRANEIDVTYFDKLDYFKQHTIKVVDPTAAVTGMPQKNSAITLYGVTDAQTAYNEGTLALNLNKYIQQSVQFDVSVDALACMVGDVVLVQHDMPQWGYAGLTKDNCTTSLVYVDRPMPYDSSKQYQALLLIDSLQRYSGSVASVAGSTLFLTNYDGLQPIKRIQVFVGERVFDLEVVSAFQPQGTALGGVVVRDGSGISNNLAYLAFDTDVIEARDVLNVSEDGLTIHMAHPFSVTPPKYAHFSYGEVEKVAKPFRIKSIESTQDYTRTIVALEYNESIYAPPGEQVPTPNYSDLDTNTAQIDPQSVLVHEQLIRLGSVVSTQVTVEWKGQSSMYRSADVYLATNSDDFKKIGSDPSSITFAANDGDNLQIKIIAIDAVGNNASISGAQIFTHTVVGKTAPPADVHNFTAIKEMTSVVLKWDANVELDLAGYEVREGKSWDSGTVLHATFAGTMFAINKTAAGTFNFHIRAVDTSGNYSANVTTCSLTLSAPLPVSNFFAVQNGDRIAMKWDANQEDDIIGYELREGQDWAVGNVLAQLNSTSFDFPTANITGDRSFMIKAIAAPGIYADLVSYASTAVVQQPDRNLLVATDEFTSQFPHTKYRTFVENLHNYLQLKDGFQYGEYLFPMNLPIQYRARNALAISLAAIGADNLTWNSANFAWNSPNANRPFQISGFLGSISQSQWISTYKGLDAARYVEEFSLNNGTTGEGGTVAAEAVGVTYQEGRFLNGALLNETTTVSWNVSIPAEFNLSMWFNPQETDLDTVIAVLEGDGVKLTLGYRQDIRAFFLEDHMGQTLSAPYDIQVDERYLVTMAQTATDRKLFVGVVDGAISSEDAALAPAGVFTALKMYPV